MAWFGATRKWATHRARVLDPEQAAAGEGWLPTLAKSASRPDLGGKGAAGGRGGRGKRSLAGVTVGPGWGIWVWTFILAALTAVCGLTTASFATSYLSGGQSWEVGLIALGVLLLTLGLLAGTANRLMVALNPKVMLTFDARVLEAGQELGLRWAIHGRTDRLTRFTVRVAMSEWVRYRRGTDVITEENEVFSLPVHEETPGGGMNPVAAEGEAVVTIPADAMHSVTSASNQLIWAVHIEGVIPRWPDIRHQHVFAVLPAGFRPPGA